MVWQDCLSDLEGFLPLPNLVSPMRILANDYGIRNSNHWNSTNPLEVESILKREAQLGQCTETAQVFQTMEEALPHLELTAFHVVFSQVVTSPAAWADWWQVKQSRPEARGVTFRSGLAWTS